MKQEEKDSIDAELREVRDCERDGQPARELVIERTYDTDVDDMWDAVTNPERIPRWFLPIKGDLRLGGHYQLEGNASGEVLACDPPAHFGVTWEYGGSVSWVDVRLHAGPGGSTRLRLEHVALVEDSEMWDQFGPGAVGIGWDLGLWGLTEHLRTGAAIAAEVAAGRAGPDAEFMARSSDAWCEADIANGTPEDVARAAAARTLAAYTGADADGPGDDGDDSDDQGASDAGDSPGS